jgi:hypothetical protein
VLFFKEIIDQKLKNPAFRRFYEQECHLCSITMKVIADLEKRGSSLPEILDRLNISRQAFEDLKEGENCDPEMVKQLCTYLDLMEPGLFENCPKLKHGI